ncbi:MAG: hypothetical protein M5U08_11680 [Burkholderiales bacterium]|nr:hypothetical protein [Burkholderiales bacterium]
MDELIHLDAGAWVVIGLALLAWSGAWAFAGARLSGRHRFAAHLAVAALAFTGLFLTSSPAFLTGVLAMPESDYLWLSMLGVIVAWGLWRHVRLVLRAPGRCAAVAVVAIAAASVAWYALLTYLGDRDDLAYMAYASKAPPPHLVKGTGLEHFLRDARKLEAELETLRTN